MPPTHLDDTSPIAPRPPGSLTTELKPAARTQVPSNYRSQHLPTQCHQPSRRHHPDCTRPPGSLTDRVEAPHPEPKYQAITEHSNCQHSATKQLDSTPIAHDQIRHQVSPMILHSFVARRTSCGPVARIDHPLHLSISTCEAVSHQAFT